MDIGSNSLRLALSSAGVVGEWAVRADAQSLAYDASASAFLFGEESAAGVTLPLAEAFSPVDAANRASLVANFTTLCTSGGSVLAEAPVNSPTRGSRLVQWRGHFARAEGGEMIGRGISIDVTSFAEYRLVAPPTGDAPVAGAQAADPLSAAATLAIELRTALGESGHGALRLAADLLLWEINTALAARLTVTSKAIPGYPKPSR